MMKLLSFHGYDNNALIDLYHSDTFQCSL